MLEVRNLSKRFTDKILFDSVNLKFIPGHTYGIIGANGAGKSTFLKILSKEIEATSGDILFPKDATISVLQQSWEIFDEIDVTNVVIMGNKKLYEILEKKNAIYNNPDSTEKDYNLASELEETYGNIGGWQADNDAQILLGALGISKKKWNLPLKELKANEKIKVLLAQSLFQNPDILIMDEPTNRLDLKSVKWLEEFLNNYKNIVIVVSHDSDFLDQVCTNIVDIDYSKMKMFTGNYSFWKESSELILDMQKRQNAKKEEKVEQLKQFIARFSANASKSKQATSRKKELEKITIDELVPSTRKYPYIRFEISQLVGKQILKVEDLEYTNEKGEILFSKLSFDLVPGEKMVILGENDIAKSRLLDILVGKLKPTKGKVTWGSTIKHAYFPADNSEYFSKKESILEWISKWPLNNSTQETKDNSDQRMRSFLGRMLFGGESVFKDSTVTSGGEKARLMFSKMMIEESNFLILDQPLDHLDTESIDSVIDGLSQYKSGLIFTTYNNALIKKVSNVILELREDKNILFRGTLEEYEQKIGF
ncbi:ABC-F family ATP-binding cassette domain-containing protein [[Mycoplasma] mobile]|nr:ABC-F family ATP-binding cassette domain-containing protein [[Mycoplasma] mobile]